MLKTIGDAIIGSVLGWLLPVAAGALITLYRKRKGATWANSVSYGAGVFVFLLLTLGILYFRAVATGLMAAGTKVEAIAVDFSQKYQPQVTESNVETKVQEWLYTFKVNMEPLPDSEAPESSFAIRARPKGSIGPVIVQRPRELPDYVVIQAGIQLGDNEKALLSKLSEMQMTEVILELQAEMARAKIGYEFQNPSQPSLQVELVRRIPIADLSENVFMQHLEEIVHDLSLVNSTLVLSLRREARENEEPPNRMAREGP